MVAPIIAGAVAPVVVQSATDNEGIINKLFKIGILVGVLVLAVISIVILSWVLEIADLLGAAGTAISGLFGVFSVVSGPVGVVGTVGTFLLSAFGFGRR